MSARPPPPATARAFSFAGQHGALLLVALPLLLAVRIRV